MEVHTLQTVVETVLGNGSFLLTVTCQKGNKIPLFMSPIFFMTQTKKPEITYLCNISPIAAPHWHYFLWRVISYRFAYNLVLPLSRKMRETPEESLTNTWMLRLHDQNSLSWIYPYIMLCSSQSEVFEDLLINQPSIISAPFQPCWRTV